MRSIPTSGNTSNTAITTSKERSKRDSATRELLCSDSACISRASTAVPAQSANNSVTTVQNTACNTNHSVICRPGNNSRIESRKPINSGNKPVRCSASALHTMTEALRSNAISRLPCGRTLRIR